MALFVRGDDHWEHAWQWWRAEKGPTLTVSRLTLFEAENTIRASVVANKIRTAQSHEALEGIQRALLEGIIVRRNVAEHHLFTAAARLSQHHTVSATFGALDILHVAAALHLGAARFLSFDHRQRQLAEAEGLEIWPQS